MSYWPWCHIDTNSVSNYVPIITNHQCAMLSKIIMTKDSRCLGSNLLYRVNQEFIRRVCRMLCVLDSLEIIGLTMLRAVVQMKDEALCISKTVNNTGSCLGFRVPVCRLRVPDFCNASLFCVMCRRMFRVGDRCTMKKVAITKKDDALQKTGTHNPQTGTQNHKQEPVLFPSSCFLRWHKCVKKKVKRGELYVYDFIIFTE